MTRRHFQPIYVISDLHLGGEYEPMGRGFRLCTRVEALVAFVDWLIARMEHEGPSELVLNGDTVDFLAEIDDIRDDWIAFTTLPDDARRKFEMIARRDQIFFDALGRYLNGGGKLTVLLGNHDVELALPAVRRAFEDAIGLRPGHNYGFIHDGEAYVIGDVLIEHGNRYDAWNQVDFDGLRRVRSLQSRHRHVPEAVRFQPPPGSKLVVEVINPIKRRYPFIDILKPEEAATIPLLLALDFRLVTKIATLARLAFMNRRHGLDDDVTPSYGGDLSATDGGGSSMGGSMEDDGDNASPGLEDIRETLVAGLGSPAQEFVAELERVLEEDLHGSGGHDMSDADGAALSPLRRRLLLRALRILDKASEFDCSTEASEPYLSAATRLTEAKIRHVVFGHTHKPKQVDLGDGRSYLNSGTWADIMAFPSEVLWRGDADTALAGVIDKVAAGRFGDWTTFHPTFVRIAPAQDGGPSEVTLNCFSGAGRDGAASGHA